MHALDAKKISKLLTKLRRFAYGLCGSVVVSEDLVQEAFTRFLAAKGDQTQYMDQWLFRTVRNLHIDLHRKRDVHERHHEQAKVFSGDGVDRENHVENLIMLDHVRDLIAQLSDEQREVLLLVGVEGYSYREAAEMLNLPIGTITSRLARARGKLLKTFSGDAAQVRINKGGG
ncbi:MAG: RNA polymerase sigma factor [Gammaproteobacteria bacterium]|nr:RNA polymerase sigma factor [Gammaproteobacteria bacterium]